MTKKKSDNSRSGSAAQKRTDPVVPPSASALERRIHAVLAALVRRGHTSCLGREFRRSWNEVLECFSNYQHDVLAVYPRKISCGEHCGVCCRHWPEDTYSFEVQIIAENLKKHRAGDIAGIVRTLREDIACLENIKKTVEQRLTDPDERKALGDIDPYDVALSSFYQFNRPCPLLDDDGSCTIYTIRPFTCRVYVSFSSPELCRPDNILGDDALTYLLDLGKSAEELFDTLHFMYDSYDGETGFRAMLYKALI